MSGSRTVKTLAALLGAMTMGAIALMVLDNEPMPTAAPPLAVLVPPPPEASAAVRRTEVDLQPDRWRSVVIHAAARADLPLPRQCHFLIGQDRAGRWKVLPTGNWLRQRDGGHIGGPWAHHSVGVCLLGDFSRRQPPPGQMLALVQAVRALQELSRVPAERVYLHSDLVARSGSPGAAFPTAAFSSQLLNPGR